MKRNILIIALLLCVVLIFFNSCTNRWETDTTESPDTAPKQTQVTLEIPQGVDNFIDEKYCTSVVLTDPYGRVFSSDNNPDLLATLLRITKKAKQSPYLGYSVDINRYYTAQFDGPVGKVNYKFYFSDDPQSCYFESASGKYYYSNESGCTEFLRSDYSEGAYALSALPKLSINSVDIFPTSVKWEYKKTDGTYSASTQTPQLGGGENVGSLRANFVPGFSVQPDTISVVLSDKDGAEFYSGDISGVQELQIPSSGFEFSISMKAVWEKNEKNNCAGECLYSFSTLLTPSAIFSVNKTSILRGEFIILSCDNPSVDTSKISVSDDADLNYIPRFFTNGGKLSALIPIPLTTTCKNVKFTVNAYGGTSSFNISVSDRNLSQGSCGMMSKETLDKIGMIDDPYAGLYAKLKTKIESNTSYSRVYAIDSYESPYNHKDVTKRAVFGQKYKFNSGSGDKDVHIAYDNIYVGNYSIPVTAVADGKVVYVGSDEYTGGLVIVDHGMGLLSWYWNLSTTSVTVSVGKTITKGTKIGNNGGGGLTETYNNTNVSLHVGLTLFDVPVDLNALIK